MALTKIPTHMLFSGAASEDLSIDSDTLFIDSSANRVGIANNSPSVALDVTGSLTVSGTITGADLEIDSGTFSIDSSNNRVGIGTTSPSYSLDVVGNVNGSVTSAVQNSNAGTSGFARFLTIADAGNAQFGMTSSAYTDITGATDSMLLNANSASGGIAFALDGVLKMKLDSSGNVGIGVTPEAWSGMTPALTLGDYGSSIATWGSNRNMYLMSNAYYDSGGWKYATTGGTAFYQISGEDQVHSWHIASSGSADAGITFSEIMRIASTGKVGIGHTSPAHNLHVQGASNDDARIRIENSGAGQASFDLENTEGYFRMFTDAGSWRLYDQTDGEYRLFVDTSGNLGLGTTSPKELSGQKSLSINGSVARVDFKIADTFRHAIVTEAQYLNISVDPDNSQSSSRFSVSVDNSERMRIDSSGNVLVGKTGSGVSGVGAELRDGSSNYSITGTSSSHTVQLLNRTTDNGDLIEFRKDNSGVGSIGIEGGDSLYFVTGNSGIRAASNIVLPVGTAGAARDNDIDLGSSGARWKDIYLGGGAYIGGTGSANKLDDYEEGTFTPVLADSAGNLTASYSHGPTGKYTKIGNIVHIHIGFKLSSLSGTGGNALRITGLPFTAASLGGYQEPRLFTTMGNNVTASEAYQVFFFASNGQTYLEARILNGSDTAWTSNKIDSDTFMGIDGFYFVS